MNRPFLYVIVAVLFFSVTVVSCDKDVNVNDVTLNITDITLFVGDKLTLTATVQPDNATDKTVTWTSSDYAIADVDYNGNVTAIAEGTAIITAKSGNETANCTINVEPIAVTEIRLRNALALSIGEDYTLMATVIPDNAADKTVTWTSSDYAIVDVDTNGKVTAVTDGTAIITAKSGNETATCTVSIGIRINGIIWAIRNVAAPGTFAAKPEEAGMFYQWNRKVGWSVTYPMINSNGDANWDSSVPEGDRWEKTNDPSPFGWRVPDWSEIYKLYDWNNVYSEWITENGIIGKKFSDKATGNSIFLPAAGLRAHNNDGSLYNVGINGCYWSSSAFFDDKVYSRCLVFFDDYYQFQSWRGAGQSIRCVAE